MRTSSADGTPASSTTEQGRGGRVSVQDLTVRFPQARRTPLSSVTVELSPGERLLVLGGSGSGKSTFLAALTGVVPHSVPAELDGVVRVSGLRTTDSRVVELARHVGIVAQDPSAGVCLPLVEQELALALESRAVDPSRISALLDAALRAVGAEHLRLRRANELSGGEAQRVAMAATLVADPGVLLLDEPTSMLDARGARDFQRALNGAVGHPHGPTIVLVEHRLDLLVGGLPERTMVLDSRGRMAAEGPTPAVLRDHAELLYADGCWLPLEAELRALTGEPGGLADPANRAFLQRLRAATPRAEPARETRLSVDDLCVGHGTGPLSVQGRHRPHEAGPLLGGVDFTLRAGEVVVLLGANGSGKSTLLHVLAGLVPPRRGAIRGPSPALVFQNPEHQFLAHTVHAEVAHGVDPAAGSRIETALEDHGLTHLAAQNPFRLSGGEQRRLSLAAMLINEPDALLLDEPTVGLDRRHTARTAATLRRAAARGTAIVLATHDVRFAVSVADRVLLLADGGVVADGSWWDVLRNRSAVRRHGVDVPDLVAWLRESMPSARAAQDVLVALDEAVQL